MSSWDAPGETNTTQTYDFGFYLYHVLPNEWPASWPQQVLNAAAVSIRSYAWYCVNHPKYASIGAALDDTTSSQVFKTSYTSGQEPYVSNIVAAFSNTKGLALDYAGEQLAGFYKAGSYGPARDSASYNFDNNAYQDGEDYWANNGHDNWSWMISYYYPRTDLKTGGGY